jgi:hypothetical protein
MKIEDRIKISPDILRQKRAIVFKAFDVYKENVNYGLVEETEQEHENIKNWYNACLNLDKNAIENVPEKVRKYKPKKYEEV